MIQAQIADRAYVVPAFGKTEKGCLTVGPNVAAIQQGYDHNATTYPDERSECVIASVMTNRSHSTSRAYAVVTTGSERPIAAFTRVYL